jgi:hypothetical protein
MQPINALLAARRIAPDRPVPVVDVLAISVSGYGRLLGNPQEV